MKITICGKAGFVRKNLVANFKNIQEGKNRTIPSLSIDKVFEIEHLEDLKNPDIDGENNCIIILPTDKAYSDNAYEQLLHFTKNCAVNKAGAIILSQFQNDNPENDRILFDLVKSSDDSILCYKIPLIIGKWDESASCIAQLCNSYANESDVIIDDKDSPIDVLFVDDLFEELICALLGHPHRCDFPEPGATSNDPTAAYDGITPVPEEGGKYCFCPVTYKVTLKEVTRHLEAFQKLHNSSLVVDIPHNSFASKLYSLYLSYLPAKRMSYPLNMKVDNRGVFTELIRTDNCGQVSINIARPGNVRGQHWHNHKWEVFIVVSGHGLIQERKIGSDEVYSFEVRGEDMRAVIMLPGYTHSITNLEKDKDLVTVMYANERFDSSKPDTFFEEV